MVETYEPAQVVPQILFTPGAFPDITREEFKRSFSDFSAKECEKGSAMRNNFALALEDFTDLLELNHRIYTQTSDILLLQDKILTKEYKLPLRYEMRIYRQVQDDLKSNQEKIQAASSIVQISQAVRMYNYAYCQIESMYNALTGAMISHIGQPAGFRTESEASKIIYLTFLDSVDRFFYKELFETKSRYITLIRHEETVANRENRMAKKDDPLTPAALEKAKADATVYKEQSDRWGRLYTRILSSPAERAMQTAQVYSKVFSIPIEIVDDLEERAYDDAWTELPYSEFHTKVTERNFLETEEGDRHIIYAQGMQTPEEYIEQGILTGKKLAQMYPGENMLVFSHGSKLRVIAAGLDPTWQDSFAAIVQKPALLKNGQRIDFRVPTSFAFERIHDAPETPPVEDNEIIYGHPLEQKVRKLRAWLLQQSLSSELVERNEYRIFKNGTFELSCRRVSPEYIFNDRDSSFRLNYLDPGQDKVICTIEKQWDRTFLLTVNPAYRELFSEIEDILPPPPSRISGSHYWYFHRERFIDHIALLPEAVRTIVEKLIDTFMDEHGLR